MKRLLSTLAVVLTFVAAASAEERTKTYDFGKITSISASHTYEVHVTRGASNKVDVVYDADYEPYIDVSYTSMDSRLHLRMDELPRKLRNSDYPSVKVYLQMKDVKDIDLSGASSLYFEGTFMADHLDVDISGASRVGGTFQVSGKELSIDASGAAKAVLAGDFQYADIDLSGAANLSFEGNGTEMEGDISGAAKFTFKGKYAVVSIECAGAADLEMTGSGDRMELEGSGACDIDARDYHVKKGAVELSGASKAKVSVSDDLVLDVDRACKLTYYGNPSIRNVSADSNIVQGNR